MPAAKRKEWWGGGPPFGLVSGQDRDSETSRLGNIATRTSAPDQHQRGERERRCGGCDGGGGGQGRAAGPVRGDEGAAAAPLSETGCRERAWHEQERRGIASAEVARHN